MDVVFKSVGLMLLLLMLQTSNVVNAQTAQNINWNSNIYYQGDSGTLTLNIYNNHSYQICTKQVYLQFDWQKQQNTVYPASGTPCIATGQSYQFTIPFSIPSATAIGQHGYYVYWVDNGYLLGTVLVASGGFYVHDAYEKVYQSVYPSAAQSINQDQNANFQGPTAISDLNQAVNYYNQGVTLANQGQWQNAVNDMNQAQTAAQQALADEQIYEQNLYLNTLSALQQQITQAQNANYKNTTAVSDLNQALQDYNQATTLASQGQYRTAIDYLTKAQSLLQQASAAQAAYHPSILGGGAVASGNSGASGTSGSGSVSSSSDNGTIFIGGVVLIIIIAVAIFLGNKKKDQKRLGWKEVDNSKSKVVEKEIKNNKKFDTTSIIDNEHIKHLKLRYAKGEITKKQYDRMKKDLE